jgi:hypothetical protein
LRPRRHELTTAPHADANPDHDRHPDTDALSDAAGDADRDVDR